MTNHHNDHNMSTSDTQPIARTFYVIEALKYSYVPTGAGPVRAAEQLLQLRLREIIQCSMTVAAFRAAVLDARTRQHSAIQIVHFYILGLLGMGLIGDVATLTNPANPDKRGACIALIVIVVAAAIVLWMEYRRKHTTPSLDNVTKRDRKKFDEELIGRVCRERQIESLFNSNFADSSNEGRYWIMTQSEFDLYTPNGEDTSLYSPTSLNKSTATDLKATRFKHEIMEKCFNAARCGDIGELKRTLDESKRNHSFRDVNDLSLMHEAAAAGQVSTCSILLKYGCQLNGEDRWGFTPLDYALRANHGECATQLRDQGGREGSKTPFTPQMSTFNA